MTITLATIGLLLFNRSLEVEALNTNLEWKKISEEKGECYLDESGEAKQENFVTYKCQEKNGKNEDCTLGETKVVREDKNSCDIEKPYCHATESQEHPYTYHDNKAWIEHIRNNGTPQTGHELDFLTWEGDEECVGFIFVCTDPEAIEFKDINELENNEKSDNKLCKYPDPTPTPEPVVETSVASVPTAPQCPDTSPAIVPANPLVWRNGDNAIVQWQPTQGDKANVYYHEVQNTANAHAVRDTENDGYVEIGYLDNLDWTFGIQQSQGCAGGGTVWIEDGGTSGWVLFRP